ncbi:MAG: amidohydrolase family protein [Gammaproteobacteria bacterium]
MSLLTTLATLSAGAQDSDVPLFVDIRQGTNLSVAALPELEFMVVELLGRLWQVPVSGGSATPLTPVGFSVRHPRLSPDGQRVVYQRLDERGWDIWLLELASGDSRAITDAPGNEREPDFLSDGSGIVFAADRSGQYDLWSVAFDESQWRPVSTEPGDARFPVVAENGAIAYVVEADSGNAIRVRSEDLTSTIYETNATLSAPSWRPGGGVIVFQELGDDSRAQLKFAILAPEILIRTLNSGEDLFASRIGWLSASDFVYAADGQIWRRKLGGSARQPVHLFATAVLGPARVPASALVSGAEPSNVGQTSTTADGATTAFAAAGGIWLLRDGQAVRVTEDLPWDEDPLIDPAGRFVVFARNHGGQRRLWLRSLVEQTPAEPLTPPDERAYAASLDPDGMQLAFLSSTAAFAPGTPAQVNTLMLADRTRRHSLPLRLRAVAPPQWLEDNRAAVLDVATLEPDGTPGRVVLDASLRPVTDLALVGSPRAAETATPAAALAAIANLDIGSRNDAGTRRYVIQAGRLFDGIGTRVQRHVDIHVEAGRIVDVVARGRLPLPETVIDATELTVLPGLIDVHTHDMSLLGELAGRASLAFGVTTVRSLAPDTPSRRALASAWNSGQLPGPRVLLEEPALGRSTADLPPRAPALLDDPFVTAPGEPPEIAFAGTLVPPLRPPTFIALPRRFSPQYAHYQDVFSLQAAAGTTEITSLAAFTPHATRRLIEANALARNAFERLFNRADRAAWLEAEPLVDALAARQQSLSRFLRAGARIAVGTEAPHTPPGLGAHIELALLAEAGIPNDQVLRSATSTAALALGLEQEIGTVEPGRAADLLVVEGDPLANLEALQSIRAVVRAGRWIDRAELFDDGTAASR